MGFKRAISLSFWILAVVVGNGPAWAVSADRLITAKIDDSVTITLTGNVRPEATAANDQGALPDGHVMEHMLLLLGRTPDREAALQRLIAGQTDPNSPHYHHWLSAKLLGARFGLVGLIKPPSSPGWRTRASPSTAFMTMPA